MFIQNYKHFNLDFFEDMLKKNWQETDFADFFKIPLEHLPSEMRKKFGNMPTNSIYARFISNEFNTANTNVEASEKPFISDDSVSNNIPKTKGEELDNRIIELNKIIENNKSILLEKIPKEAAEIKEKLEKLQYQLKELQFTRVETIHYLNNCYHEKEVLMQELEELNRKFNYIYVTADGTIETDEDIDETNIDFEGWDGLFPTLLESEDLEDYSIKQVRAMAKLLVLTIKITPEHKVIFESEELEDLYNQLISKK